MSARERLPNRRLSVPFEKRFGQLPMAILKAQGNIAIPDKLQTVRSP